MKRIGIYCLDQDRDSTSTLGVYHYTRRLVHGLAGLPDPGFQVYVLVSTVNASDFTPLVLPSWMRIILVHGSFGRGLNRLFADHVLVLYLACKYHLQAIHYPKGWIPFCGIQRVSSIATIHDVIPLEMAKTVKRTILSACLKRLYFKAMLLHSAKMSHAVITVSEDSQRQIVSVCPCVAARMRVIHNGPGLPVEDAALVPRQQCSKLFIIGSLLPHKATRETLRLLDLYAAQKDQVFQILLSGLTALPADWEVPSVRLRIEYLGRLPDDKMVAYISHARAMLFLSSQEGAGLPLLEGYLLAVPVLFRDIPPMNEYVDSDISGWDGVSTASFFAAMDRLLALDDRTLNAIRQRLLVRFSWASVGKKMLDIYEQVLRL